MLTTLQIERAKPATKLYRLFDGLGLYIEIDPNGGKYWRFKYQFLGKEKRLAVGKYPEMSLIEARAASLSISTEYMISNISHYPFPRHNRSRKHDCQSYIF